LRQALLLFDWHLAEEFEHREVALKLYMRIAAKGHIFRRIWYGYFYRIFGTIKMMTHSGVYIDQVRNHLLAVERREMSAGEVKASVARERKFMKEIFWKTLTDLIVVLSPFYNPANKPPPAGLDKILANFAQGGKYGKSEKAPANI